MLNLECFSLHSINIGGFKHVHLVSLGAKARTGSE